VGEADTDAKGPTREQIARLSPKMEVRTHGGDIILVFSEPVTNFRMPKSLARKVAAAMANAALR